MRVISGFKSPVQTSVDKRSAVYKPPKPPPTMQIFGPLVFDWLDSLALFVAAVLDVACDACAETLVELEHSTSFGKSLECLRTTPFPDPVLLALEQPTPLCLTVPEGGRTALLLVTSLKTLVGIFHLTLGYNKDSSYLLACNDCDDYMKGRAAFAFTQ